MALDVNKSLLAQVEIRYFRPACPICGVTLHGEHWNNCAHHVARHAPDGVRDAVEQIATWLYGDISDFLRLQNWPLFHPKTYKGVDASLTSSFTFRCPVADCRYEFKGNGFDGIDAHWKANHESLCGYDVARKLIVPISKEIRTYLKLRAELVEEFEEQQRVKGTSGTVAARQSMKRDD